jgi:hypothetical protein
MGSGKGTWVKQIMEELGYLKGATPNEFCVSMQCTQSHGTYDKSKWG